MALEAGGESIEHVASVLKQSERDLNQALLFKMPPKYLIEAYERILILRKLLKELTE